MLTLKYILLVAHFNRIYGERCSHEDYFDNYLVEAVTIAELLEEVGDMSQLYW